MFENRSKGVRKRNRPLALLAALAAISLGFTAHVAAQDQDQDDPPGRVARLGYLQGSVSFQPAGEDEWVEATPNRPMTTGDKLWADRDSRAEVQLGSATLDLAPNTGFSFLNLDDRTIQIQLSAGSLNVRVWDLDRDNIVEVDTPNQAFTVDQPGRYRLDVSEDGNSTIVTIRDGEGEATGNGQSYTMHRGQRFTFSGTTSLNAEVEQIGAPDDFDNWSDRREMRYQESPSARYCSRRVVGYQDLDDNGDWRPTDYGYAWFPRVDAGWAPYHDGHWAWIDPWGWTWVDDDAWGYAPFHYGRWAFMSNRWGWIPGPREERPVYAPALVAFVGGGFAAGATVAWFPLGPREVYVPSYRVSPAYVNRVNVTNTTVNTTTITNVYNTTIVKNNTTINNVTYVNRNVNGAVAAVPQHAFANAQPVQRNAVAVNREQMASTSVMSRAAVSPARESVMGAHANTANHVAAPPQAVASRQVIAKATPPPPPPSFAAKQQVLAQHPGQPVAPQQMQKMRPATATAPMVRQAPPAKPATPTPAMNRPAGQPGNPAGNQPGNPAGNMRPNGNPPPGARPEPGNQPGGNRPEANQPPSNNRPGQPGQPAGNERPFAPPNNRPQPNQPQPGNRPEANQPPARNDRPAFTPPNNRPEANQPQPGNRPEANQPPASNDRPPAAQPENRPAPTPPANERPQPNQPQPNRAEPPARNERPAAQPNNRPVPTPPANERPQPNQPQPNRAEPPARNDRPPAAQPNNRPPAEARPAQQQQRPQQKQNPPDKKKQNEEDKKPQ